MDHDTRTSNPTTSEASLLIAYPDDADLGLICGFRLSARNRAYEIDIAEVVAMHNSTDEFAWLHFNLGNARARRLLSTAEFLPAELRQVFEEHDVRRRVELFDAGLLVVISDFAFDVNSDAAEVEPLWCYIADGLFITARTHAVKTTDQMRSAVREGLCASNPVELLAWILNHRTETLRILAADMTEQVGEIEDEILAGNIKQQRELLGRVRRLCARLRRHFGPDRTSFLKLLQKAPNLLSAENAELIRGEIDELSFLINEVNELYERAKLLQEELGARVAEDTGRSLYVLAILSAVFLPMTLITGIFGMNVAGLPGLHGESSFSWVMLLIVVAGVVTLASIFSGRRRY